MCSGGLLGANVVIIVVCHFVLLFVVITVVCFGIVCFGT